MKQWNRPPTSRASAPRAASGPSKRDLIVNVFLRQEGHLTADDLVDLIRREDQRISRATVYRTLQWMVDAGIARKVDFGEGRFRFEHSYRHPRHFHLICKTCNRSFEFLSSDIEALIEEVAAARSFTARQSVLQIHGTCEACRTGRPAVAEGGATEMLFARDALRIAIATERSGLEFYSRAARADEGRARAARLPEARRRGEGPPRRRSNRATASCSQQDPQLESQPDVPVLQGRRQRPVRRRRRTAGQAASNDRQALMIGIRCERGSHRFFKRYGERFEDSEGKRIFLEFADEERAHLELLIREYRALVERQRDGRPRQGDTASRIGGRSRL